MPFLPVCPADMRARGWDAPDFVLVTGDAYVDHPSFGTAVISRVLEAAGFRIAILPPPDWKSCAPFKAFGRPRLEVPPAFAEVYRRWNSGEMSSRAAAERLGISQPTFLRWVRETP